MIPLYKIYWDNSDIQSVQETIKRGNYWAKGPNISIFENKIAKYVNKKHGIAFNSGTSALISCLIAYNFPMNSEIIVPSFTFTSSVDSIAYVGYKPVFSDIEAETYGLDPEKIKEKITTKTVAIIPTQYGGGVCKIKEICEIAEENNLVVIEDSSESLGAKINEDELAGSFGESALFSFTGNKIITTGEGGMLVTNSDIIEKRTRQLRSNIDYRFYENKINLKNITKPYNFNWRMSDITASLGISQFDKLEKLIELRQKNASFLSKKLQHIDEIIIPQHIKNVFSVFQMYTIRIKEGRKTRDDLKKYLADNEISSAIYFEPIHKNPYYKRQSILTDTLEVTEKISSQVLTLPMYPTISEKEMTYISNTINTFFNAL